MKNLKIAIICIIVGLVMAAWQIRTAVIANYQLENNYTQLWKLSDKSSTIPAKQKYIAQFVAALKAGQAKGDFAGHDAKWLQTPNNDFGQNLTALKSLEGRLDEIQKMDPTSFQYNTAIEQITKQEQGEAGPMMNVFKGCYLLQNYPMVWGWICGIFIAIEAALIIVGGIMLFNLATEY
jgi:hypothetical protein